MDALGPFGTILKNLKCIGCAIFGIGLLIGAVFVVSVVLPYLI